jgi:hypothetical protein
MKITSEMQLAGATCGLCQTGILLDADGTWCARCKSVLHRNCLIQADSVCPKCAQTYDKPENYFKLSEYCPECMRKNEPATERCPRCHTATCWDTVAGYQAFLEHMKDSAAVARIKGLVEFGLGFLCLGATVLVLIAGAASIRTIFALILGFMLLVPKGIGDLLKAKRYRQFK